MPEEFPRPPESSRFNLSKAGALGFTVVALAAAGMAGFAPRNGEVEAQSIAPSPGQPSYYVTPEGATFPADQAVPDVDGPDPFPKHANPGKVTLTQKLVGEADRVDIVLVSHSKYLRPSHKSKQNWHIDAASRKPDWPLGRLKFNRPKTALMTFNVPKKAHGKVCFSTIWHAVDGAPGKPQIHETIPNYNCINIGSPRHRR